MKFAKLALILALAGCHPLPATASDLPDIDTQLRESAEKVCSLGGAGGEVGCIDLVSAEYFDAVMAGANSKSTTPANAVLKGRDITGCKPMVSPVCKLHVQSWATWFMYGNRRVTHDAALLHDAKRYSNGDPDFMGYNSGYDDQPIPREDLNEWQNDEPYEQQYTHPGDMDE